MFKKWFSRKKDDDDEDDYDEDDFDEEDMSVPDDEAGDPTDDPTDSTADKSTDNATDDISLPGDTAAPDDGEDIDIVLDGDADDDDDDDDEEESRLVILWDNPWVRFSLIGVVITLLLVIVGIGGWWFISSGSEGDMARQTAKGNLPSASSGGGLQPSNSLNALSSSNTEEGQVPTAGQLIAAPVVSNEGVSGEQLENSVTSGFGTSSGLNALGGSSGLNAVTGGGQAEPGGGIVIPMSTASSFSQFPDYPIMDALSKAPISELLELRGEELPLPKVSLDGRASWQEYARPSNVPVEKRRVAVLVSGLGLSRAATLSAISKLPAAISLSFSPYAEELEQWMIRSRRKGHEVVLGLPLESTRFPIEDAGPLTLRTHFSDLDNKAILETILSSQQGYIGVDVFLGSKFTSDEDKVRSLLTELNLRGLMIIDGDWNNRSLIPRIAAEIAMPLAVSNVKLDDVMAKAAIDAKLAELDSVVELRGHGIGSTTITPAIMERLLAWVSSLPGKGVELVPVSALIKTR